MTSRSSLTKNRALSCAILVAGVLLAAACGILTSPKSRDTPILYVAASGDSVALFLTSTDGRSVRRLVIAPSGAYMPRWSPDGRQIVFTTTQGPEPGIYVVNADGTNLRRVFASTPSPRGAEWSPDGTRLATVIGGSLFVMNVDGTGQVVVPNATDVAEYSLAWSPDGTRLAFTGWTDASVHVIGLDGSNLTTVVPGLCELGIAWSRATDRLAFARCGALTPASLYTAAGDGSGVVRVTDGGRRPSWSPDGRELLFESFQASGQVWVVDADGNNLRPVTRAGEFAIWPTWRPAPAASSQ